MTQERSMFTGADIIHRYTRAQALDDGALVPADEKTTREAGFVHPVAMTAAVWHDCVEWTEQDAARPGFCQNQSGRLWDVLWMASRAGRRTAGHTVDFTMVRIPRDGEPDADSGEIEAKEVTLCLDLGPGDEGEPVFTIMFPHEY